MSVDALEAGAKSAVAFLLNRREAQVCGDSRALEFDAWLDRFDFHGGHDLASLTDEVFHWLGTRAVRSDHPRYFGLFNPPALPAGILGDLIAATVNPQLAVCAHAPAAAAIEAHVARYFCACAGWDPTASAGTFTSGGSEANHTALLAALASRYPDWSEFGLRALGAAPAIYVSANAHLAWIKIARMAGLGSDAVRLVPMSNGLSLRGDELAAFIAQDHGYDPILVVATAGTTSHGAIDDIPGLTRVARQHRAHVHVDAAWAGGALLVPECRAWFEGVQDVDSLTLDPHKWLAVPMGAGLYLARTWKPQETAFAVDTSYMPSASIEHRDAYIHTIQWSRRFIGLKLFMSLASLGQDGYADILRRQIRLGRTLRARLASRGWRVVNDTTLPLVCFVPNLTQDRADDAVGHILTTVLASGEAWLSTVACHGRLALRACITSYETTDEDVDRLVELLDSARAEAMAALA